MDSDHTSTITSDEFRTIIASSIDGFLMIDQSGSILETNSSFCQMAGYTRSQLIGMHISEVDAHDTPEQMSQRLQIIAQSGSMRFEARLLCHDGSIKIIEVSAQYVDMHGGAFFSFVRDITRQRQIEQTLNLREDRFRLIVENAPYMILMHAEGKFTYLNPAAVTKFGLIDQQEYIGMPIETIIHPEFHGIVRKRITNAINNNQTNVKAEEKLVRKDGSAFWAEVAGIPMGTEVLVIAVDIDDRINAEAALRDSEVRFRSIFNNSPVAIGVGEARSGLMVEVNDAWLKLLGYDRDEVIGRTTAELSLYATNEERNKIIGVIKDQGRIVNYPIQIRHKSGSTREILYSADMVTFDALRYLQVMMTDITERKQAEQSIRRLNNLYAAISACSQAMVHCRNEEELLQQVCQATVQFGGMKLAWVGFVDPATHKITIAANSGKGVEYLNGLEISVDAANPLGQGPTGSAIREKRPQWCQDFLKNPSTAPWHERAALYGLNASASLPLYRNDVVVGALTLYSDETEVFDEANRNLFIDMAKDISFALDNFARDAARRQIKEQLVESEEKFRALFENNLHGVALHKIILDDQGNPVDYIFLQVNPAFEKHTGMSAADVLGKRVTDTHPGIEKTGLIQIYGKVTLSGEPAAFEQYVEPTQRHYNILAYRIGTAHFAVIFDDITHEKHAEEERRKLEQQFQQAQKLEGLGILAGGIAHDFNNILAIIMGYCSLIKMDYTVTVTHLPAIEKAAERAAGLCRQMLAYAGKSHIEQTLVNMVDLVHELVDMLRATIQKNVAITLVRSPAFLLINGDESQIRQIVMNLVINASEAIGKEQGTVNVTLKKVDITVDYAIKDHLGAGITPGHYACLEVTDTGCGMDEGTKQKIFEPFFTTKFTGRGLGMSAVLGIIKAHNGALQLKSEPGAGTTFRVYLPIQVDTIAVGEGTDPSLPSLPWLGSGTALLVEDEEHVRTVARLMLIKMGFTVIEASNGKEGLEQYHRNATAITVVFTDLGMPVMDGYALIRELNKINPDVPIIVSSGFGEAVVTQNIMPERISGMVSKPYDFNQMREVMKSVLEGARPH